MSIVVIRLVRRYKCRLSSKNSVSPPSAAFIADSVMGNGRSGSTGPMISIEVTTSSCPPSLRSSTLTVPLMMTEDSINAEAMDSNCSSPTASRFATHCIVPVESRRTTKRILLEPRVLLTHPFSSTSAPSWSPFWTSPIQMSLAMNVRSCHSISCLKSGVFQHIEI